MNQTNLKTQKTLAVFPGTGMGDALLAIMVAHNAVRNGYRVEVFSNILRDLDHWFPEFRIQAVLDEKLITAVIESHDLVYLDKSFLPNGLSPELSKRCVVASKRDFDRQKHYLDNLKQLFTKKMNLQWNEDSNGVSPPAQYQRGKYPKRICLHVTSANVEKNWPLEKFLKVAAELKRLGYQPVFVLASHEFEERRLLSEQPCNVKVCASVEELAVCLYESAAMIANDSGPGHLAACLGLPVVSIFNRKSNTAHWKPLAKSSAIVTPCFRLPGRNGHRYWKKFICHRKVMKAFRGLGV
jgi:heptosyltransferase III